jgi:hypothetical protein
MKGKIANRMVLICARVLGTVTTAGEPFLGSGYTALHVDIEDRLMKEDAIDPEIHAGAFSYENPVMAS